MTYSIPLSFPLSSFSSPSPSLFSCLPASHHNPDKRKPGLKDTDYQAVATKPLTNFNKYFRYVSLGYSGTATKPSWTYKTAVDWRTQVVSKQNRTVVGPTVDQGTCAACWALVPVAAIEAAYAIAFGSNQPNISGQHILNCQGTWECVGGLPSDAFQFAASGGVLPEFIVPYTGTKYASSCPPAQRRKLAESFPPDLWFDRALEDHLHASPAQPPPSVLCAKKKPPPAPAAQPVPGPYRVAMFEQVAVSGWLGMVIALQAQPIIANVEADQTSFIEYTGGYIYADPDCFINGVVNHIVLLVGYSMSGATPYFIAQNTWGATWGVGGFMQMAIASGDGICGINTSPALYPVVRGPNPCVPNPCGSGTCSAGRGPGGYTCKCKTNFVVGKNIDQSPVCIPLKPCSLNAVNPCQVGTCLDDARGGYNCICPPGFFFDTRPDNTPSCILGPTPDEIKVVPGLTCDLVMSIYGITLTNFTQLNPDLNCKKLKLGDDIHIGDTNPCATPYTVTSQTSTCASIAAAFNITTVELQERNHELKCNKALQIGQQLFLFNLNASSTLHALWFPVWDSMPQVCGARGTADVAVCVPGRGTADLPVCQEYVTVAEGDTCDTIMRSARPPLTGQEFYALNPGINCNVGDQSLLGQQVG
ncbi:unnamed protein product [Closterium sp. Naga37s-1]|nr:unnamed protein product [Closterium sp. Naga37s-1]